MAIRSIGLILLSVLLSGAAQVAFKYGLTRTHVQAAMSDGSYVLLLEITRSAGVLLGLVAYAASAVLWLLALSKAQLSFAYPFVALGIVITVVAGAWLFAESLTPSRIGGIALICCGVLMVAMSHGT